MKESFLVTYQGLIEKEIYSEKEGREERREG